MELYLVLLLFLLLLWALGFRASGCEIMAPVSLVLLGMAMSVALAIVGFSSWNDVELSWRVVAIVGVGCVSVLAGSLAVEFAARRRNAALPAGEAHASPDAQKAGGRRSYVAPHWKYVLLIAIILAAMALRIYETNLIAADMGIAGDSYSQTLKNVRTALATINSSDGIRIDVGYSMVERQLEKFVLAAGYVLSCILAGKMAWRKPLKEAAWPLAALCLAVLFVLLSGGRGTAFFFVISFIAAYVLLRLNDGAAPRRLSIRVLVVCVVIAVVGSVAFYGLGFLIGRPPSSGIVEYISFYFGCGVPSLQMFFDQGLAVQHQLGQLTFYNVFAFLYKFGLVDSLQSYSIAWVNLGGHSSNVFTCFARPYLDFGIVGVAVLGFASGAVLTLVYRWARNPESSNLMHPCAVVLSGYLAHCAFDMMGDEFLFSRLLSPNGLVTFVLMFAITLFLATSLRDDWGKAKAWLHERRAAAASRGASG